MLRFFFQEPGEVPVVSAAEDCLPRVRRCAEPQGRPGEDRAGLPDRGAEDRHEGSQGAGSEVIRLSALTV